VAWGEFALRRPGYLQEQWTDLEPLIRSGALAAPIGHRLPLAEAAEGLALMDERRAVGKVVLLVRE
jgi:NADPH2:quinone reductase